MSSRETLDTFRRTHPICQITIAGNQWCWYIGGVGSQTVVILPGAGAFGALGAEVMFPEHPSTTSDLDHDRQLCAAITFSHAIVENGIVHDRTAS